VADASGPTGVDPVVAVAPDLPPLAAWAVSGAMDLSGEPSGPPLGGPSEAMARLKGAALVVSLLAAKLGGRLDVDGPTLLGERAAIAGLQRQGRTSVGGASRLLRTLDGWVAVTLARPSDFELLPAWFGGQQSATDPWDDVEQHVASRTADSAVETAQLLGLPIATVRSPGSVDDKGPWQITRFDGRGSRSPSARRLVIDLTSLWAGPLCTGLLASAGARVIKVEAPSRPDGARRGPAPFFDLLNAGKESVLLELDRPKGQAQLRVLLEAADVVVESARPRVMRQWGIDVEAVLAVAPATTWVSITGYGRHGELAERVAFGDDAAASGGLLALAADGSPCFCADAAADPAAGLHAAAAALSGLVGGGTHLFDVSLSNVAASLAAPGDGKTVDAPDGRLRPGGGATGWEVEVAGQVWPVAPPRARRPLGTGPPLGRDTEAVLAEFC
jgi:hypothetical protein